MTNTFPVAVYPSQLNDLKLCADLLAQAISEATNTKKLSSFKRNDYLSIAIGYKGHTDLIKQTEFRTQADSNEPLSLFSDKLIRNSIVEVFSAKLASIDKADIEKACELASNTINPLWSGSTSVLSEHINSLHDDDSAGNSIWIQKRELFVRSWLRPLVYLRDQGELTLSIEILIDYVSLDAIGKLVAREDIPDQEKRGLYNYIKNMPGIDSKSMATLLKGEMLTRNQIVRDQHGYISGPLVPALIRLANVISHVKSEWQSNAF